MQVRQVTVELVFNPQDPTAAERVVATFEHEGDDPTYELELELVDGRLLPVSVSTLKKPRVVSRDLRLPLESYLEMVAAHPALTIKGEPRDVQVGRRRRVMTDAFLRSVAEAYVEGGRTLAAVKAASPEFTASDSQVSRWVKAARERGFLTDEA